MKQRAGNLNDKQLSAAQVTELEAIADSATSWARNRAQAWLSLYDGREYANTVLLPEDDLQNMARGAQQSSMLQEDAFENKVYPNPVVDDYLTVSWKSAESNHTIMITDVAGRIVIEQELNGTEGQKEMNVNKLSKGMYLYRIHSGKKLVSVGKFIKQ